MTYTCGTCDHTKTDEIPMTEHTWTDWAPNGDENHKRECMDDICDASETLPHDWDDGVVTTEPSCTEKGEKTYTCQTCQHAKTEDLPITDHPWGDWAKKDDQSHIRECKCGKIETKDHEFGEQEVILQPTDNSIHLKQTCAVCGYEKDTVATGTVVTFTNCEGLNANPLVFAQSGDDTAFTLKLPTAADVAQRNGYKLIGWSASIDGVSYAAGAELFIAYADVSSITFTAEWAMVAGEGEQKLAANEAYITDMDAFEIEGEGIIYQGDQVFYVPKSGLYTLINVTKQKEVPQQ
jgi:hypothetical protein